MGRPVQHSQPEYLAINRSPRIGRSPALDSRRASGEMADAPALGAGASQEACRFDSDLAYQAFPPARRTSTAAATTR
jgi:hypothetical protein